MGIARLDSHRGVDTCDVCCRINGSHYGQHHHKQCHKAKHRQVVGWRQRATYIAGDKAILKHHYKVQRHQHSQKHQRHRFEQEVATQCATACTEHFAYVGRTDMHRNKGTEEVDKVDKRNKDNGKGYGT